MMAGEGRDDGTVGVRVWLPVILLLVAVVAVLVGGVLMVAGLLTWGWFLLLAVTMSPLMVWVAASSDNPRYDDPDYFTRHSGDDGPGPQDH